MQLCDKIKRVLLLYRPFNYSKKESKSNNILLQFVEFSNVHNSDRNSNATRSNIFIQKCMKITLDPDSFVE